MAGHLRDRALGRGGLAALAAYGLLVALAGSLLLSNAVPEGNAWPLLGGRLSELQVTFAAVEEGAPPLIAHTALGEPTPGGGITTETSAAYRLVGQGDDQGMYVAAPLVAKSLGLLDVREGIKWIYVSLFFLALITYPLIFHRITGSVRAAVAAPLVLLGGLLALDGLIIDSYSDVPGDLYWVLAWAPLALLPPLLLLARETSWRRWGVPLLLGIAIVAALASTLRINAGLPIILAGVLVVLARPSWSWPLRGIVVVAFLAAYAVIVPAGMSALRHQSQDWASDRGGIQDQITTEHPFWHSIFIGSGYLPNDDLIIYRDEVGFMRAQERDPDVGFLSPQYEDIERDLYLDEVRADPLAMTWQALRKSTVVVRATAWLAFAVTVFFAFAFLLLPQRRLLAWGLGIALPGVLLGLVTGLLVIPDAQYVLAWTGSLLFMLVVGVTALTAGLDASTAWRGRSLSDWQGELASLRGRIRVCRPERLAAFAAGAVVFFTLAGAAGGARVYNSFKVWWTDSAGVAYLTATQARERSLGEAAAQSAYRLGASGPAPALPKAVGLDGVSGAILSNYDPFTNAADLTVEGWARRRSTATEDALFGSTTAPYSAIFRLSAGSGDAQFFPANGVFTTWPGAWPDSGKWVHWAFVFDHGASDSDTDDARTVQLYINGIAQGEMQQPQGFDDGYGKFVAGGWAWNYRDAFDGDLSGIAVYERALSPEEVASHFMAGKDYVRTVATDDPGLFWKLEESKGVDARDSSGSGNDGVYVAGA